MLFRSAARVAFLTLLALADQLRWVRRVRFVLFSNEDLSAHERVLKKVGNDSG